MHLIDVEIPVQQVAHVERHVGNGIAVLCRVAVQPAGDHIGVADGLDLLHAVFFRQFVEGRKDPVEHGEYLLRGQAFGNAGEIHDVGKHDRNVGKAVGNRL